LYETQTERLIDRKSRNSQTPPVFCLSQFPDQVQKTRMMVSLLSGGERFSTIRLAVYTQYQHVTGRLAKFPYQYRVLHELQKPVIDSR